MIELRLLGTVSLTAATGGDAAARSLLAQPRRLALLAYLAAATPRTLHRRDVLLPLFWPELDQARARAALRQALHVIRAKLGADALVSRGDEEVGIDFERVRCDVVDFEQTIAAGRPADALDLYRGPLLEGFFIADAPEFERWLETERARLHDAAVGAARTLVDDGERQGDLATAARWARHAARLEPLDEALQRRLIGLLDRLGDRAGALQAYELFAGRLQREFEAQPSAETQGLIAAVRARQSALVPAAPPQPAVAPPPQPSAPSIHSTRPRPVRRIATLGVALGLVVVVATVGARILLGRRPPGTRIRSLAVLPLRDLSGDTTLSAGMTMALTTNLGEAESLQITSPRRAAQIGTDPISERAVGESLGVDAVVEGDVQRAQDSLRVDLRLIDVATGRERWARHFEDGLQSRFALEEAMAEGVFSAIAVQWKRPAHGPPPNSAAYDAYSLGRLRIQNEDARNDSAAIMLFERAVALDGSFAAAYAELAHAYGLRWLQFAPTDTEARDRARVAADKALALDPDLAQGHFARAFLLWCREQHYPHERVIDEDRQALRLDPNLPAAHHHLGLVYLHIGLLDSAIAEFKKTLALDPTVGLAQQRIGIALVYQGHYAEGLQTLQEVPPALNPALWHYQVAWALLYAGRDSEAQALIDQYLHDNPKDRGGTVTATRAILDAERGDARAAGADIASAVTKGTGFQHFHHAAYSIAMAYAQLHRPEPAVRFLRMAVDGGLPCYPCFAHDPFLAPLRDDPGYRSLMRDLEDQWNRRRAALFGHS